MKITVVGTGYVGLVTGACLAETGNTVTCIDIDEKKIKNLKEGLIPIYEPGLETIVKSNIAKKRLFFSTDLTENFDDTEVVFSAVGTPPDEDGSADLKYVLNVARQVAQQMKHYMVIVTKSTVPIGTAEKVRAVMQEELSKRKENIPFDVASNPEFLKEGSAVEDFLKPDRIVVGTDSERALKIIEKLYKPFILNGHPIINMDIPSAEMTKYAANAMLATKISFMNDIANLCEIVGADVTSVRNGIGSDARIGHHFIYAGTGYGGSCFPKDVKALIKSADESKYSLDILKAVENVNERQKSILFAKIYKHFNGNLTGKRFAMWGLAFKPNTDDMREAPALKLIEKLTEAGAKIVAYDPAAAEEAQRRIGKQIEFASDPYDAMVNADAMILVTEWREFRIFKYKMAEKLMNNKLVFDGRNIFELEEMKEHGFTYYSIGRKTVYSLK
jgi:UDPglucose 6-dehydrogenase